MSKRLGYILIGTSIILLVLLTLVKIDIDKKNVFLCEEVFSGPENDMQQCPAHKSNISWYLTGAFGMAILILFSGIYLIINPITIPLNTAKLKQRTIDISKLDKEEKKIYDLLKQNEGSMYQSDLIKETEFSKVHMTRILDKMEGKKIIERKRRGMTNIIVLQ